MADERPTAPRALPYRLVIAPDLGRLPEARRLMQQVGDAAGLSEDRAFDLQVVVSEACALPSHYASVRSLGAWMEAQGIPGIEGIDTRAYYVPPVHRTRAFAAVGPAFEERLPQTAALCDEILTLPDYGRLTAEHVERVAACMMALHERAPSVRQALGGA